MSKKLFCLSILVLFTAGIAAADHDVFVNGAFQNGWTTASGMTTTTFGAETVCRAANASPWFWRGMSNPTPQSLSSCGTWQYEIYCDSAGGGSTIEWHKIEATDWSALPNFKTGCSVDGVPVSLARNLGFDAWHTVAFDVTIQSWWASTAPSVRYLKWQFPQAGTYYIRNVKFLGTPNLAPTVSAGGDQSITLPASISLDGTVSDDGQVQPVTVVWEKAGGPGTVTFGDPNAVDTTASFSMHGTYSLRLSAYDGEFTTSDEMLVSVFSEDGIITNEGAYPNNEIPKYKKFEVTFLYSSSAQNPHMPYDTNPPAGLQPGIGASIDGLFTPDNWTTTYTQPGFYYKDFTYALKGNEDWWYPTGQYYWKVRFAPDQAGTWKYKVRTQDASGLSETEELSFVVCDSNEKGFLKVSETDERYFEFDNGEPFVGLGHNLRFGQLSWDNPVKTNTTLFQKLNANGTQFFRSWLSHWSIYGSTWAPWNSPLNAQHGNDPPYQGLSIWYPDPNSEVCLNLRWPDGPAMFLGFMTGKRPPIKRDTNYKFSVRYHTRFGVDGPRIAGYPYGVVAKVTSNWLDDNNNDVYKYCDPDVLRTDGKVVTVVTDYGTQAGQWSTVEGTWNSGTRDYLPYVYVVLENVNSVPSGVQIDTIEIREDLGGGQYGPCIIGKSWFAQHLYMDQHKSWAFDKTLELAEQYDIYLKLVLSEKNDWIADRIAPEGHLSDVSTNDNFYGEYRTMTKGRWLQNAWYRYCQARWGYSTHIHSWELCNEGDPWSTRHYAAADEMGIYMHQFKNKHLVTTSFWHSWPKDAFWANASYPNVDFADFHRYESAPADTAESTRSWSELYGAKASEGAGKPLVRGETGFGEAVEADTDGIWLHNFAWGMINPGGMYDHYWDNDGEFNVSPDPRRHFRPYRNFMDGIPLNNGHYVGIAAVVTGTDLRAWGQKDLTNGTAHLWIQNMKHLWKNIVDGVPMPPVSGTVDIAGFAPNASYKLQWWDAYQSDIAQQIIATEMVNADASGSIRLTVSNLATDVAAKIIEPRGDINADDVVNGVDLQIMASQWLLAPGTPSADLGPAGGDDIVNLLDFAMLADRWLQTY